MKRISITHMNNAHGDWLRALDFYKEEIVILRKRLGELAGKNTLPEVLKQVEHFENQLAIQKEHIDLLSHDIHANVADISKEIQHSKEGYISESLFVQHNGLATKFADEEKIFNAIRHEFNQFSSAWM